MPLARRLLQKFKYDLINEMGKPGSIELTLVKSSIEGDENTFVFELKVYNEKGKLCTTSGKVEVTIKEGMSITFEGLNKMFEVTLT